MSWLRREDHEDQEQRSLAPAAAQSRASGGRRLAEPSDPLRTEFQRDRDRIIHSTAFRRLQHKTQVFSADEGDHYRSRMTHSLEVSQMARSAALALRLNPDLAEAIALAHDLGHPPFGHVGEEALHALMRAHGGFRHNAQGSRIVDHLEDRHGHGFGLNLTLCTRRSLLKGRVPEGFPLAPDLQQAGAAPLEASLVDRCDKIAYLCHDLDDGLRAGLLAMDDVRKLDLWQAAEDAAGTDAPSRVLSRLAKIQLQDLVQATAVGIAESPPRVRHDSTVQVRSEELLRFLREQFYRAPRVLAKMQKGAAKIEAVFARLCSDPDALPASVREKLDGATTERVACDYIAGMTDRFLMRQ